MNKQKQYLSIPKDLSYSSSDAIIDNLRLLENIINRNYEIFDYNNTYTKIDIFKFTKLITEQEDTLTNLEQYYHELTNKHFKTERQTSIYNFNKKLAYLRRISYSQISELASPNYLFVFMDNDLYDEQSVISLYKNYNEAGCYEISHNFNKGNLLSKLKTLGIGQWNNKYSRNLESFISSEIIRWILTFEFVIDGKYQKIRYDGNSIWPHNFLMIFAKSCT